jgi:hypothetical protein
LATGRKMKKVWRELPMVGVCVMNTGDCAKAIEGKAERTSTMKQSNFWRDIGTS